MAAFVGSHSEFVSLIEVLNKARMVKADNGFLNVARALGNLHRSLIVQLLWKIEII